MIFTSLAIEKISMFLYAQIYNFQVKAILRRKVAGITFSKFFFMHKTKNALYCTTRKWRNKSKPFSQEF